jgi:hypothetical protein
MADGVYRGDRCDRRQLGITEAAARSAVETPAAARSAAETPAESVRDLQRCRLSPSRGRSTRGRRLAAYSSSRKPTFSVTW